MLNAKTCIAAIAAFITSVGALAAPGQLDSAFGIAGARRLDTGSPHSLPIDVTARQPDGKLVVAGYWEDTGPYPIQNALIVGRFNVDGSPDTTFGVGGWGRLTPGAVPKAMVVQPDGKIVVVAELQSQISIYRLMPDGFHDDAFAMNHGVVYDYQSYGMSPRAMALHPSGKYLVVGQFVDPYNTLYPAQAFIIRYNADGTRDTSYGTNGPGYSYILPADEGSSANALAFGYDGSLFVAGDAKQLSQSSREGFLTIVSEQGSAYAPVYFDGAGQGDTALAIGFDMQLGRIVVAGRAGNLVGAQQQGQFLVARFMPSLTPDWSFGTNGVRMVDVPIGAANDGDAEATSIGFAQDGSGDLILGGTVTGLAAGDKHFAFVHLNNGIPAPWFGNNGVVVGPAGDELRGMSVSTSAIEAAGVRTSGTFSNVIQSRYHVGSGAPDSGFGTGGSVVSSWIKPFPFDVAHDLGLSGDGSIIGVGSSGVKLTADGSLDGSFGVSGIAEVGNARSTVVYPDGSFVVAGDTNPGSGQAFSVQRFIFTGAPDLAWNGGNPLVFQVAPGSQYLEVMRMQPDGKLLLGGYAWVAGGQTRVALARLNANGTFDTSFNGTGKLVVDRGVDEHPHAFAFQADGKILIGTNAAGKMTVLRLTSTGALDTSWGVNGAATGVSVGSSYSDAASLAIQPDGKVIAGGDCQTNSGSIMCVARFTTSGALDPTWYASPGLGLGYGSVVGIHLQADGKVIVGGDVNYQPATVRLLSTGMLDNTWNGSGYSQASMFGIATSMVVQPDGKPVIVATSNQEPSQDWLFVRWEGGGDGLPDQFSFTNQAGVATGAWVSSAPITVTGFDGTLWVESDVGDVSVGCGQYPLQPPQPIVAGQTLCVHHQAASTPSATVTQTIRIGVVTASFSSTTVGVPDTTITSAPPAQTNSTSPSFSFTADAAGATFECKLDGAAFAACTSPQAYSSLAEGPHTFQVRAVSAGGTDPTPATHAWTIDVTGPDTTITGGPSGLVNYNYVNFTFSSPEPGATFECRFDGAAFAACSSPVNTGGHSEGNHTFDVRAKDAVGNVDPTPATRAWTIDITTPNTTITSGPLGAVSSTSATFTFTSPDPTATFECRLDGAAFTACASPQAYSGLAEGQHVFDVRAKDPAGNIDFSPDQRLWVVDTIPPDTTITAGPTGTVASTSATFQFTPNTGVSARQCRLDGGAWTDCSSPVSYSSLSQGPHTFEVRVADGAGNFDPTPALASWTVDTVAPDTTISSGPSGAVASTSAAFTFTATEAATFQCSLDGAAFAACTSPVNYSGLAQGSHTFQVRATDGVGNQDATAASVTWTVDTTVPDTTITGAPGNNTAPPATFTFTSGEAGATFECRLDGAAFAACTSPHTYATLPKAQHTFEVRARDAAGNVDATPATHTWRSK